MISIYQYNIKTKRNLVCCTQYIFVVKIILS